jgi:enoyl-CoA hydratase/carnithine racemase
MNDKAQYRYLNVDVNPPVVTITLNRPEVLNACNSATHLEVQQAIDEAELNDDVKVLVFAGSGRSFCAGSDLREVSQFHGAAARRYIQLDFATKNRVAACRKPVVAALHGHVVGGGFELALACDIRFVAEDVQFSLPEISLGTIPGSGGLQRLPQIVGLGIAKEWALTGRRIGAEEALRTGLANRVVPHDQLMPETLTFARELGTKASLALNLARVALDPSPPPTFGLAGTFHVLASQVCHDDPAYRKEAGDFIKKRDAKRESGARTRS